jgi:transposase
MLKYTLFIGIDISKKTFDACITWSNQKGNCPHQQFDQTEKGFKKLLSWIKKYSDSFCPSERRQWFVYAEHTGL